MATPNNPFYELNPDIRGLLTIETFRVQYLVPYTLQLSCLYVHYRKMFQQQTSSRESRQVLLIR